jgi:hypothetical protein
VVVLAIEDVTCTLTPDDCLAQRIEVGISIIPSDFRVEELVHIVEKVFERCYQLLVGGTC